MCQHLTFTYLVRICHYRRGERRFQSKVKNIINVIKFSSFSSTFAGNKVGPAESAEEGRDEEIEVLISSHLAHFM